MAIKTREELMSDLSTLLGENDSDEALAFIQDMSDTLSESGAARISQLEQQVKDTDAAWRKRYRETFFSGKPETVEEDEQPKKPRTFAELFTTK